MVSILRFALSDSGNELGGCLSGCLSVVPGDLVASHLLFPGHMTVVPDRGDAAGALLRLDLQRAVCWASLSFLETRLQPPQLFDVAVI